MAFSLVVLNGKTPGRTIPLQPGAEEITLGRHISNDLQVDDDRASRMHACVAYRAARWHLEDCGSLNGTYVNSQLIQRTVLETGDLIRIGDRLILFVDAEAEAPGAESPTAVFRATTMMGRQDAERGGSLVEESVSESMSRVVRDSAVLCRLANLLHRHSEPNVLINSTINALVDGIDADSISFWLVSTDGRLRDAGHWGERREKHILASLAVEKDKAILVDEPSDSKAADLQASAATIGHALGVPVPGGQTCRGAIECHRRPERRPFSRGDLDFSVVVAHQAGLALENLEHRERLELANAELRRRVAGQSRLAGKSPAMEKVFDQMTRVGPTGSTVLILGESGTGKELVARSLHDLSRNSAGPYVAVNCAAFSESLLESELFGHEIGAFTGADHRHVGQFERATRGTIFLDEIGEMSMACQAKLLRVLEGHPFQRLGGDQLIKVDVRVIAATHRDLPELIREKQFREDLYYRLRVIDIRMPPLRDRGDDVLELAAQFLESFHAQLGRGPRRLSQEAVQAICAYSWPGNVRELKNAVERAVVLGQHDEVQVGDLGLPAPGTNHGSPSELMTLKEAEQRHLKFVLEKCNGNKTQACKILGIGRATLYSKLAD